MIELKFEVDKLDEYKEEIIANIKTRTVLGNIELVEPSYLSFDDGITLVRYESDGWHLYKNCQLIAKAYDWTSFKICVLESDI